MKGVVMYTSSDGNVDMRPSQVSGWAGWIFFGAVIMLISGTFSIIWGIVAIARDEVFVAGPRGTVVSLDYTTWGWIHLILGIVVVATGLALFRAPMWARALAIVIAGLSAVGNLLVIGSQPAWSIIVIALDVLVIYAVAVHGGELANN
jgi:hypothetical protein